MREESAPGCRLRTGSGEPTPPLALFFDLRVKILGEADERFSVLLDNACCLCLDALVGGGGDLAAMDRPMTEAA